MDISSINPSKLLVNSRFDHATCGMSRETVGLLRGAVQRDKDNSEAVSSCQQFANNMVELIDGLTAAVIVAPPVGAMTCYAVNNNTSASSIVDSSSFDLVIWFLLDITDIDSKQTTFINKKTRNHKQLMSSLYRLEPSGGIVHCGDIDGGGGGGGGGSIQHEELPSQADEDEEEELIAYDHNGRVIDESELSMLRSVNMLGTVQFVKKLEQQSSNKTLKVVNTQESAEIEGWMDKVRELINLPRYKTERELPCQIFPGLYLSSMREARSSETLSLHQITHVFSCIDDTNDTKTATKARKKCQDANVEFTGIWSVDEVETDMMTQHYKTFKDFADPLLNTDNSTPSVEGENDVAGERRENRILVHCEAGVNRSGLLVVAYAMSSMRLPVLKALEMCLEARGPLLWNTGFQKQLVLFAKQEGLLVLE